MNRQANNSHSLDRVLTPYLELDGIDAAMLVSTDGLLIAAAGTHEFDIEALAAYSATALSAAIGLAEELETRLTGSVTLDLHSAHLTLAQLSADLFLILVGSHDGHRQHHDSGSGLPEA